MTFTRKEIEDSIALDNEASFYPNKDGTLTVTLEGMTWTPIAKRVWAFFGISEDDVEHGEYDSAWIDGWAEIDAATREVTQLSFAVSESYDDTGEVNFLIESSYESAVLFNQIMGTCSDREMLERYLELAKLQGEGETT